MTPRKKAMPRSLKVVLWAVLGLMAALVLCVVLISTVSWTAAKPWINRQASALAHRQAGVEGDLTLRWVKPTDQAGWRRWLPWPEIHAENITLGNPWDASGNMAEITSLTVVFNPWALFAHTVQIRRLDIEDSALSFERRADKTNNWTFGADDGSPSRWNFELQNIHLKNVAVRAVDVTRELDLKGTVNSAQASSSGSPYGVGWTASGTYRGEPVEGKGQLGKILSLQQSGTPFPVQGEARIGATTIAVEGSFTRQDTQTLLDVKLKLAGDSMSELFPIIGVVLPTTPPYHTEGRLMKTLAQGNDTWRYEDFKGVVGESDLEGTLQYQLREPRSILTGELESRLLRFQDLGPLVGADTSDAKGKTAKKAASAQPKDKALPVKRIDAKRWGAMDADVKFTGHKILRDKDLPLDNITAHLTLQDRVLSFTPLNFGIAGGTLSNTIRLDGRSEQIDARLKTVAKRLKLKELFPGAKTMDASFGQLHGDISLAGRGTSIATLLAHSNGTIEAIVSRGTISKLLLETAGLNIANIVITKLFGDKQITLNCLAGDFKVTNGLVQTRVFKLETEEAVVDITGQVNFANEGLDLDVRPANKALRIFTLRSPLYVKGTFKHPDVGVQKAPLAARAGAAIALGVVATPFAAILPLLNLGTEDSDNCAELLATVNKTPKGQQAPSAKK